jgi:tryptophan synthase alpha chain
LADGPVIFEANQKALEHKQNIDQILDTVFKIKSDFPGSKTKIILMSYSTPIINYGLDEMIKKIKSCGLTAFIIPDLTIGSPEQIKFNQKCIEEGLQFIPLVSPISSDLRLKRIAGNLREDQIVYATARTGKTGQKSNLEDPEVQAYLNKLKDTFPKQKIALGFGIRERGQVSFLNSQGVIAVIGSQIVRILKDTYQEDLDSGETVSGFLTGLGLRAK